MGLTALAAVSVAVLLGISFWPRSGSPQRDLPSEADGFPAGSRWSGTYHFAAPIDGGGDVSVAVAERAGDRFNGTYTTDNGDYKWRIEGTAAKGAIRWEFKEAIHEREPMGVVGVAVVEGTYAGDRLDATYRDSDSTAQLTLRRFQPSPAPKAGR